MNLLCPPASASTAHPPSLGIPQTSAGPREKQMHFGVRHTHTVPPHIYGVCQASLEINQVPPTACKQPDLHPPLPATPGRNQAGTPPFQEHPCFLAFVEAMVQVLSVKAFPFPRKASHHLAEMVWLCACAQLLF